LEGVGFASKIFRREPLQVVAARRRVGPSNQVVRRPGELLPVDDCI
jgi:hypothetical protein